MDGKDKYILDVCKYKLTTAEIIYHLPDYPELLQSYIWQEFDTAPKFPVLYKFLKFWETNLDGALHSVKVSHVGLVNAREFKFADGQFLLQ